MAYYQTEYHTAPTPYSIQSWTPYTRQQYLQSRGSWQIGDNHLANFETESWMLQDDRFDEEDQSVQQRVLQTRQTAVGERHADSSLASWKIEKIGHRASIISDHRLSISRLNLSTRGSTADLKDFLQSRGNSKLSGLHLAATKNDVNMITAIIKREGPNVHINQLDENECTPLMYAVLSDSVAAIELLLHCGAKREEVDSNGRTAVHYAAFFGKAKALRFLIESAAHWMPRDVYGRTPLHWSSKHKDTKCLQVLIKHSSIVVGNINIRDYEGMSPLHCAAQYCRPKHVQVLYEANCDFSITDIEGKTALHWTVNNPDSSCIEALVYCYPSLLNVKDMYGQTVLHLTAKFGVIHLIETLLTFEGIEIDVKDNNEQTPLHVAAMVGHSGPVQMLLLHNALDSCIDSSGLTALHYAVLVNSSQCVQHLIFRGSIIAHIPSADDRSQTPLMMAAINGHSNVINVLLSNDEIRQSIDNTDPHGQSALHLACEAGTENCVLNLINQGANPNLLDKANRTPLMSVCSNGNASCVGPLIEGGADTVSVNQEGYSCMHVAVRNGHTSVVEQLTVFGVSVETLDDTGNTPLQLAIALNSEEMVQLLLDRGTNPNSFSMDGLTAAHYAASEGYLNILKLLLERQSYVNEMDRTVHRYTPLDYAEQNKHTDCVNLLIQHGGITINSIKNIAAICMQSVYRRHRARKQLTVLKEETVAVIIIQRHVRGFLKRVWYTRTIKEIRAATKIQTHFRGFNQRRRFGKMLEIHRLEEKQRETIETFGKFIQTLRDSSVIIPISLELPEQNEVTDIKHKKTDEQTRKERSLRMREIYLEKQRNWELFRQAEQQRRIDKTRQEKMDYMNKVLRGKQERRLYCAEQFRYTTSVRSHYHAAIIIQRCYRRYKWRKDCWRKMAEARCLRDRAKERFAASVIQNAWKKYKEWKKFEKTYMCPIYTSPIVRISERQLPELNEKGLKSYERSTLTSGIGRRKLHQTQSGGFKIFKPIPTIPPSAIYTKHPLLKQQATVKTKTTMMKRTQANRMNNMKVHWPWVDKLFNATEDNSSNTDSTHLFVGSSLNENRLKLPHIN